MGSAAFGDYNCNIPQTTLSWNDGTPGFTLYELKEVLHVRQTADAYKMAWDDGVADYVADITVTYEVRDMMRCHWGITGERVRARVHVTPTLGAVNEVTSGSAPWYEGALDKDLDFNATATATVMIYGVARTITVTDRFLQVGEKLLSGARVGIVYDRQNARFVVTEAMC